MEVQFTGTPVDNKVHLSVRTSVAVLDKKLSLSGTLPTAVVLPDRIKWSGLPPERRNELIAQATQLYEAALVAAVQACATALQTLFHSPSAVQGITLDDLRERLDSPRQNLLNTPNSIKGLVGLIQVRQRAKEVSRQVGTQIRVQDYPSLFPAYHRERKVIAVLGPTNSGKTYGAFKRLAEASSGLYLGPLRLLALEAYNRLNDEFGVKTSLITGEERRIDEDSKVTASTIEMLDPAQEVEVAVIDEIQLLTDPYRGWSWVQGVVAANASEIWVLGALSAEDAIRSLTTRLGIPLEVRYTERKNALVVGTPLHKKVKSSLAQAEAGDAFIVFSRRNALNLRDDLIAQGTSVACIYGALSPEVRENEAKRFATGEASVLVATDAIGMGLNLPIKRVVFTATEKFDGTKRSTLSVPLLQQIGGRAGRYGQQDTEYGVVCGITSAEHEVVKQLMRETQPMLPTKGFAIAPGTLYLETISRLTGISKLEDLLMMFLRHTDHGDKYFVPYVAPEQLEKADIVDKQPNLPLSMRIILSLAPMPMDEEPMRDMWRHWVQCANRGKQARLDFLMDSPAEASLEEAELAVRLLSAYRWLGHRMPEIFVDVALAESHINPWVTCVDAHLRSRRRQGTGWGRSDIPAWYSPPKT